MRVAKIMEVSFLPIETVREHLRFHSTFPAPELVRVRVRALVPRGTTITKKAICAQLRHRFTNYDQLSRSGRWDHDELRKEVNRLILKRIGDAWIG